MVGICVDRDLIPDVETPISEYFGVILATDPDPRKLEITVRDLLTMSAGFDWPEFGEWNFFAPMVYSHDIVRFILDRPLIDTPGARMNYNSGCSHLLGAIIQQVTNRKVEDFANDALFAPLGITDYKWYEQQGQNLTADGLRLKPIDMLKFGELYLNNGTYQGNQIISPKWIIESTRPYYRTYDYIGSYGYHWWVADNYYFALGYQGQYTVIVPEQNVTIVITSRLENTLAPLNLIKKYLAHLA